MRMRLWVVGAIVAAVSAVPSVARADLSHCDSNYVCLWGNNDFKWMLTQRPAGSGTIVNLLGDANNEMDSWANRSATYNGCGFGAWNGGGDRQTFWRADNDNNVAPWNSDEVSSWRTRYGC